MEAADGRLRGQVKEKGLSLCAVTTTGNYAVWKSMLGCVGAPEFGSRAPTPHVLPTSGQQPATDQPDCLRLRLRTLWTSSINHAVAVSSLLADNAEGGFLGHPTRHDLGETDCEPAAEKKTTLLPTADRPADTVWETNA